MKNLIIIAYFLLLLILSIFSYLFIDPNLFYYKAIFTNFSFNNRVGASIIYASVIILLFFVYFLLIKSTKVLKDKVWKIVFLSIAVAVFAYPAMLSYDIFNYMLTAKVAYFYRENPYVVMPIEFINEPMLSFTHAANKLALYGPFWIMLSAIPHFLGFGNFIITLFLFKFLPAGFYLGTTYFIYKISGRKENALYFSLNPLVVIESLVSAHNDIAMVFFALLAFYLIKKNAYFSFFFLICSVLIKYATIFLAPIYIICLKGLKNKNYNIDKLYLYAAISLLAIFLLSPLREEIYPWYFIWPLSFLSLTSGNKLLKSCAVFFSFGLMLRYLPYMLTGSHFDGTPLLRIVLMVAPIIFYLTFLWLKKYYKFLS